MALLLSKLKLEQIQGYPHNIVTLSPLAFHMLFLRRDKERDQARARSPGPE